MKNLPLLTALAAASSPLLALYAYTQSSEIASLRRRDEWAWEEYKKTSGLDKDTISRGLAKMLAAREADLAACKATRKDDGQIYAENRRYEQMLVSVEDFLRVSEGMKAACALYIDRTVPAEVRAAVG